MRTPVTSIFSSIAMLFALVGCATAPADGPVADSVERPAVLRVGTFDSRGVALAYGRSARPDCRTAKGIAIRKEHEKAARENDTERMRELEAEVEAIQKEIHRQVFCGAPIPEILGLIEDEMPRVAGAAKVPLIVSGVLHTGAGVEVVDVTMQMCAPFRPDDTTRRMIRELIAQPVLPESALSDDR